MGRLMGHQDIIHLGATGRLTDGRLPLELAQALPPLFRTTLGNPIRRDILRSLGEAECPKSLSEIAAHPSYSGIARWTVT